MNNISFSNSQFQYESAFIRESEHIEHSAVYTNHIESKYIFVLFSVHLPIGTSYSTIHENTPTTTKASEYGLRYTNLQARRWMPVVPTFMENW